MLLLQANQVKKLYGERLIFTLDRLSVYSQDRVGIVGLNGAGKTTLMNILVGIDSADEGTVRRYDSCSYLRQLEDPENPDTPDNTDIQIAIRQQELHSRYGVDNQDRMTMSGGEKTRLKIAQCFHDNPRILCADEPTSNLDLKGIELLEEHLSHFEGAILLISHDRTLMDRICTRILEIEDGKITEYPGNYSAYRLLKDAAVQRQQFEHMQYVQEKNRLKAAMLEKADAAKHLRKTPSRMGNSEARLHKRGVGKAKAKLERAAKAMETRIQQLEEKEKPKELTPVKFSLTDQSPIHSKVIICGTKVSKSFNQRVLFDQVDFDVLNGEKVALIGENGSGKTTLLEMIKCREKGILVAERAQIGYLSQNFKELDEKKTILANVVHESVLSLKEVRMMLARMLFQKDDVYKEVRLLSGGERVKVALAMILCSKANVLVLDEPTNYLDIYSLEALAKILQEYEGTLLFVSHDRRFVNQIANCILSIENKKVVRFLGNYDEYLGRVKMIQVKETAADKILQLENRLSEVVGKLSASPKQDQYAELDAEYHHILLELKALKSPK